jgi:hypothetical protein
MLAEKAGKVYMNPEVFFIAFWTFTIWWQENKNEK